MLLSSFEYFVRAAFGLYECRASDSCARRECARARTEHLTWILNITHTPFHSDNEYFISDTLCVRNTESEVLLDTIALWGKKKKTPWLHLPKYRMLFQYFICQDNKPTLVFANTLRTLAIILILFHSRWTHSIRLQHFVLCGSCSLHSSLHMSNWMACPISCAEPEINLAFLRFIKLSLAMKLFPMWNWTFSKNFRGCIKKRWEIFNFVWYAAECHYYCPNAGIEHLKSIWKTGKKLIKSEITRAVCKEPSATHPPYLFEGERNDSEELDSVSIARLHLFNYWLHWIFMGKCLVRSWCSFGWIYWHSHSTVLFTIIGTEASPISDSEISSISLDPGQLCFTFTANQNSLHRIFNVCSVSLTLFAGNSFFFDWQSTGNGIENFISQPSATIHIFCGQLISISA